MSSSVFFKFKSMREPQRITFDGTGISVFELKREIIAVSGLGDGTDFDLAIYPEENPTTEYDDDTEIISRSSSVLARRQPASKPGAGKAARYVSGRAPVRAIKNSHRVEATNRSTSSGANGGSVPNTGQTEEEREAAFLLEAGDQWEQQKEAMSHAKPVFTKHKKPVNVPAHPPPVGYICYRCGEKGHWIQECPTNDDPNFKAKPRIKRTTGIPRSFLKTVEKPSGEDGEEPRGVMVNAEGEYVIAEPDRAAWEKFQEKAKVSAAQAETAAAGNKEIQERGLECPIDKRMFVEPTRTPCCGKTYCFECIETALIDGDLTCPNCSKEGVLIDDLMTDDEMMEKIRAYEDEKAKEKLAKEQKVREDAAAKSPKNENVSVSSPDDKGKSSETNGTLETKSPQTNGVSDNVNSPLSVAANPTGSTSDSTDPSHSNNKKRAATDELENDRKMMPPTAPKAMRQQQEQQQQPSAEQQFLNDMQKLKNGMPLPMNNSNNNPMTMSMSMGMPMNPMMGMMNPTNNQQWNGYNSGYPNMPNNMYGMGGYGSMSGMPNMNGMNVMNGMNSMNPNMAMNSMNGVGGYNNGSYGWQQNSQAFNGMGNGMSGNNFQNQYPISSSAFPNQQRTAFSNPLPSENDAYFRKPVNPNRHQHKNRRARPFDYTQL